MLLGSSTRSSASRAPEVDPDAPLPVVTITVRPGAGGQASVECAAPGLRPFPPSAVTVDVAALTALDADPAAYGAQLGAELFAPTGAGPAFDELRTVLLSRAPSAFRVRVRLDDPSMHVVRWERLTVPWGDGNWRQLATAARTPLSRVAFYQQSLPPIEPIRGRRLRVLLIIASPTKLPAGMGPIDVAERAVLQDAIGALGQDAVEVTVLETGTGEAPTVARVRAALATAPDIVHILCHGAMTPSGGVLYLEKDDGSATVFFGDELASSLESAFPHARLVVLSACESATPASVTGMQAVGPLAVARGADAVLAMHGPLSIPTATRFMQTFYARLYAHGQVDLATAEARAAVVDAWDWSVPVLFMRHDHGRIIAFDVGDFTRHVTSHATLAAQPLAELPQQAAAGNASHDVIDAMTALQHELGKSHEFLVGLGDAFRRTGTDPTTFAATFAAFRLDFDSAYDRATWIPQQTSCHEVHARWGVARPFVQGTMDPVLFSELDATMQALGMMDNDTLQFMGRFLDEMKIDVDAIEDRLVANDVAGAISAKRAVERRLSDSFRQSKSFLQSIAQHVRTATAA
jgi:hypothetical protein